ncbi:hypothetical protein [Catellatospora sp. NPDC049609]|uniref:hypothetical protein n=1 Tax=Catellatospora sp. NPDC049609 TaxID=3155505 RepID=UPI0034203775
MLHAAAPGADRLVPVDGVMIQRAGSRYLRISDTDPWPAGRAVSHSVDGFTWRALHLP